MHTGLSPELCPKSTGAMADYLQITSDPRKERSSVIRDNNLYFNTCMDDYLFQLTCKHSGHKTRDSDKIDKVTFD